MISPHLSLMMMFWAFAQNCASQETIQATTDGMSHFEITVGEGMSVYPKLGVNLTKGSFVPKSRPSASLLSSLSFAYCSNSNFRFSIGYSRSAVSVSYDELDVFSGSADEYVTNHNGFIFRLNTAMIGVSRSFSKSNFFIEPGLYYSTSHIQKYLITGGNCYLLYFQGQLTTGPGINGPTWSDIIYSTKTTNIQAASAYLYAGRTWRNLKMGFGVGYNRMFDSPFDGWYQYRVGDTRESRGNFKVKTNHLDVLLRVSYRFASFNTRMQKKIDRDKRKQQK